VKQHLDLRGFDPYLHKHMDLQMTLFYMFLKRSGNIEWENGVVDTLVLNRLNGKVASYVALQYMYDSFIRHKDEFDQALEPSWILSLLIELLTLAIPTMFLTMSPSIMLQWILTTIVLCMTYTSG
jgi:hypothetical protein